MSQKQFKSAYDAYQRAVMRDNRNPTFWCSIGVLYYQINQSVFEEVLGVMFELFEVGEEQPVASHAGDPEEV